MCLAAQRLAAMAQRLASQRRALCQAAARIYAPDFAGPSPGVEAPEMRKHVQLIADTLHGLLGRRVAEDWRALHEDPRHVVLSTGTQPDPILNYGNLAALDLFEATWQQLTTLPGRHTAELETEREERQRLLDAVTRDGFALDYSGVRVALSGRRFLIRRAAVFNLRDQATGEYLGQAAWFPAQVEAAP